MVNQQTQMEYTNLRGIYTSDSGDQIRPGFVASIGFTNLEISSSIQHFKVNV
jgi:hypothetical protein